MDTVGTIEIDESKVVTEIVNCPVCGSNESIIILEADNIRRGTKKIYSVAECKQCSFRYVKNPPDADSMKLYYPKEYYSLRDEPIRFSETVYYTLFRNPRKFGNKRMLDVGCGNGKYVSFMQKRGWFAEGQDVSEVPTGIKRKLRIHQGELYNLSLPRSTYDLITSWWSIEHERDPLRMLQACHDLLAPQGKLIVGTLNSNSFEAKMFGRYWHHLLLPEHCSQFSDDSLVMLIKKAGFSVQKIQYHPLSLGFANSIGYMLAAKNIKLKIMIRLLTFLFLPLDVIMAILKRSSLIVVHAEKKLP
jgi:SAM-dependent methyltransferase